VTQFAEPSFPAVLAAGTELRQFDRDLITVLGAMGGNLAAILDGGISVRDNLDASLVSVSSHATPGTEFSVAHGLGKVPVGRLIYEQTGAGSLYAGTTANTKTTMYFRSDAAAVTFSLVVF
jgi:hypothetical protein